MKKLTIIPMMLILLITLVISCDNMPDDLKQKKNEWNARFENTYNRAKNANERGEVNILISEYSILKEEVLIIIDEFEKRKVDGINKEIVKTIDEEINTLKNKFPASISFENAKAFMQKRCQEIGQTLMDSKTTYFEGTKLYMFLTFASNGKLCISSISEDSLEILAANCGLAEIKMEHWNSIN